jgi:2-dehydropantoate 2-reductase
MHMRIGIVGAGGAGGFFGAHLIRAGHEVVLIARGAHLDAIRQQGLQVITPLDTYIVTPYLATDDPADSGKVDLMLVTVKTWQLADSLPIIRALMDDDTMILPLLNGVEAATILAEAVGQRHVIGGLCHVVAAVTAPGQIQQIGSTFDIVFGELDGSRSTRMETLHDLFTAAAIPAVVTENMKGALWEKLLFVAPFGVVGALTRSPLGTLRTVPETRRLLIGVMGEIAAVATACGVSLDESAVSRAMSLVDRLSEDVTASLQRDIIAGRRSELEAQAGDVIRFGAAKGVPMPILSTIYACLVPYELRAQSDLTQ